MQNVKTPPQMNICILVVGTRGDVQPFLALGQYLKQQDGHRVRLATHAMYRQFVVGNGLEFAPLAGDPKELSAYMVKTEGQLIPTGYEEITQDVPRNMKMIEEILNSCWPAVSAADPDGGGDGIEGLPFVADAIISNPVTYGHIHVAEKLGVPLHIMFPQPWVPTKAFPHPLANMPVDGELKNRNFMSYKMVDLLMWQGVESMTNKFRTEVLNLRKIRKGDKGRNILLDLKIPHAFMWSPHLVPKPKDWGPEYDILGTLLLENDSVCTYSPSQELTDFLSSGEPPIFVGFGSMVIDDPASTTKMIMAAAKKAKARVLVQSSWSDMSADLEEGVEVFFIKECPHDWLLPQMAAVVHHGGAGTTAAGLYAGMPTFICPFFGDQPFWGYAVSSVGAGVSPCHFVDLTSDILSNAFKELLTPAMQQKAKSLQSLMKAENGVKKAAEVFYKHLPLSDMLCDVDPTKLAKSYCVEDGLKISRAVEHCIYTSNKNFQKRMIPYRSVDYSNKGPDNVISGFSRGAEAFLHESTSAAKGVFADPARGLKENGLLGATKGMVKGMTGMLTKPAHGVVLWADKIATGHKNTSISLKKRRNKNKPESLNHHDNSKTVTVDDKVMSLFGQSLEENSTVYPNMSQTEIEKRCRPIESINVGKLLPIFLTKEKKDEYNLKLAQILEQKTIGKTLSKESITAISNYDYTLEKSCDLQSLTICILVAGSKEILEPFIAIGMKLVEHGHRIRLATHEKFKNIVLDSGLEFFPLSSSPNDVQDSKKRKELNGMHLPSASSSISLIDAWEKLIYSTHLACTEPNPEKEYDVFFKVDAIISNPMAYAHIHLSEALGVPLHIFGAVPCIPTGSFLCPYSNVMPNVFECESSSSYNSFNTHLLMDTYCNESINKILSNFREYLKLPIYHQDSLFRISNSVPQSFFWSTRLIPNCLDWNMYDAVGYLRMDNYEEEQSFVPTDQLAKFLSSNDSSKIIYVSLNFCDDDDDASKLALYDTLLSALDNSNHDVRILLNSSNNCAVPNLYQKNNRNSDQIFILSSKTPERWVLRQVDACIHHGSANLTMLSIELGLPTLMCPSLPEQSFYAMAMEEIINEIKPIPILKLTSSNLSSSIDKLLKPDQHEARLNLISSMEQNSIDRAVAGFYRNLPLDIMLCDVDSTKLARLYDNRLQLKLSYEASLVVHSLEMHKANPVCKYVPCLYGAKKVNNNLMDSFLSQGKSSKKSKSESQTYKRRKSINVDLIDANDLQLSESLSEYKARITLKYEKMILSKPAERH